MLRQIRRCDVGITLVLKPDAVGHMGTKQRRGSSGQRQTYPWRNPERQCSAVLLYRQHVIAVDPQIRLCPESCHQRALACTRSPDECRDLAPLLDRPGMQKGGTRISLCAGLGQIGQGSADGAGKLKPPERCPDECRSDAETFGIAFHTSGLLCEILWTCKLLVPGPALGDRCDAGDHLRCIDDDQWPWNAIEPKCDGSGVR